jgi:hypothetical protein
MIKGSQTQCSKQATSWSMHTIPRKIIVKDDTGTDEFRKMIRVREFLKKDKNGQMKLF